MKKNKLTFIFLSLFSFSASALTCQQYDMRFIDKKQTINKKEQICLKTYKEVTSASSTNCSFVSNKKCPFSSIKKGPEFESFISEMGSPGFNICYSLKGSPQIYEINIEGKWITFERCFWKGGKEFIDIGELISIYKAF